MDAVLQDLIDVAFEEVVPQLVADSEPVAVPQEYARHATLRLGLALYDDVPAGSDREWIDGQSRDPFLREEGRSHKRADRACYHGDHALMDAGDSTNCAQCLCSGRPDLGEK
ncbi:hypothetical protein D3874_21295 [Oleomonas cavernae]|uniref:Uncharacterized protein n=1 Tax=Oleomonas cavernae TaxID=2320859 RepID=A0A418WGP6_9PROT|nr:hypothetical protein [Oleomonas cavernae]RJF89195.1 hypothetical protein D3874_21295 [Oleomonas cavernae]